MFVERRSVFNVDPPFDGRDRSWVAFVGSFEDILSQRFLAFTPYYGDGGPEYLNQRWIDTCGAGSQLLIYRDVFSKWPASGTCRYCQDFELENVFMILNPNGGPAASHFDVIPFNIDIREDNELFDFYFCFEF